MRSDAFDPQYGGSGCSYATASFNISTDVSVAPTQGGGVHIDFEGELVNFDYSPIHEAVTNCRWDHRHTLSEVQFQVVPSEPGERFGDRGTLWIAVEPINTYDRDYILPSQLLITLDGILIYSKPLDFMMLH